MVNRPIDFDITTPTGSHSPRQGDDELRKIKTYTQNAFNDFTQAEGGGLERHNLHGINVISTGSFMGTLMGDSNGNHNGVVGNTTPAMGNFTTVNATDFTAADGGGFVGPLVGDVTGALTGNADTATSAGMLTTARNIQLSGAVTGNADFDGSGNIDIECNLVGDTIPGNVETSTRWSSTTTVNFTGDTTGSLVIQGGEDAAIEVALTTDAATSAQGALADSAVQPMESLNTGTGTLTVNEWVFVASGSGNARKITASLGGNNIFSVDASGNAIFAGNVTANGSP